VYGTTTAELSIVYHSNTLTGTLVIS